MLDSLPFSAMSRKLEQVWSPDKDWIGVGLNNNIHGGIARLHWQAGQPISDTLNVSHGFEVVPRSIVALPIWTAFTAQNYIRVQVRQSGNPAQSFNLTAITGDGSNYAVATDRDVYWIAMI